MTPGAQTVPALLQARLLATPLAPAYLQQGSPGNWTAVSWQAFAGQVQRVALGMAAAGLRHGDRLCLIAPVALDWELVHHAALAIGVVVVGMDAHDLPERIAAMVELADITAFACSDSRALARVRQQRLAEARLLLRLGASDNGGTGGQATELRQMPPQLQLAQLEALAAGNPAVATTAPAASDDATIIFTSGTTGAPKGIVYTHGQLRLAVDGISSAFDFTGPHSHLLCWLPLSNLFQRVVNLAAVRQGSRTYLLGDPRQIMDTVAAVSPDVFIGVPRFYEKLYAGIQQRLSAQPALARRLALWAWNAGRRRSALLLHGQAVPAGLRLQHWLADRLVLRRIRQAMGMRLQCMVTGSAPMSLHLLQEFHALGWLVLEAYGLSENVLPMAMNCLGAHRFGTVGKPLPGNEIVIDSQGVVKVRGAGVFTHYLGAAGQRPLDDDGFYITGDLGEMDADGYLRLTGRINDLIKTSTGRRVAPAAVEAQLTRVPGIDQGIVIGNGRKCLVALCTPVLPAPAGGAPPPAAFRQQLAHLNEADRPKAIALLDRPFAIEHDELTPNLKLRRRAIESRHAALIQRLYDEVDIRETSVDSGPIVLDATARASF